ncbi:MAG: methyltransferase domain-containing protein [Sphingomonadales bacterium]|nr:methyltransferase domain-containing protein [Sphingomonadales bacterium]
MTGRRAKKSTLDPLAARRLAVGALGRVLESGVHHEAAFAALADRAATLDPADRAFARLLLTITLRRLGQIDAVLAQALSAPEKRLDDRLRAILRLGAAQLLFLGTPPHAAVATMVELASRDRLPQVQAGKGLVNAVLRRLARDGAAMLAAIDLERTAVPAWLWSSWVERFGEATTRRIIAASFVEPMLDLSIKPGVAVHGLDAVPSPTGGVRLAAHGRIERLPGFAEGSWWVQDAAAALPAKLLNPQPGERALDLCAAPGGKTLQLAAAGAEVTAVDQSAARLERLRDNLARTKLPATVIAADGRAFAAEEPFDAVLLDAPCAATGTIRRHPEIAWLRKPEDVAALAVLQAELLDAAARLIRPGGRLIYAVCSLQAEEGPAQIAAFLARHPQFKRAPIAREELLGLSDALLPAGDVQTLPFMAGGVDGFYIARLRRTA